MKQPSCANCVKYIKKEKRCLDKYGLTQAWDLCPAYEEQK